MTVPGTNKSILMPDPILVSMKLLVSTFLFFLASCHNTTPVPINEAEPVPPDRLFVYEFPSEKTTATIEVFRDRGSTGADCHIGVFLNHQLVARIDPGERARFAIEPGTITVGAGRDPRGEELCSTDQGNVQHVEITLANGDTKRFRVSTSRFGRIHILPIPLTP